jgi:hypothetical protein
VSHFNASGDFVQASFDFVVESATAAKVWNLNAFRSNGNGSVFLFFYAEIYNNNGDFANLTGYGYISNADFSIQGNKATSARKSKTIPTSQW